MVSDEEGGMLRVCELELVGLRCVKYSMNVRHHL